MYAEFRCENAIISINNKMNLNGIAFVLMTPIRYKALYFIFMTGQHYTEQGLLFFHAKRICRLYLLFLWQRKKKLSHSLT